ncbi:hypothetical protein RFI_00578 [Reticulomyxa filosa]|uniref:Cytochrome b5 heme-binding domain-containing protein n=1 Tax=Reticulomyxa filosa TaxID=46433 RepID=X6PE49_RETFI|nr:hypothetical protein RFI_00578 [Reticulomyxa filosa]|eukprot:ETO36486.1 hypothetical protein RFI_00578 [Reticulomyxa filosa]
MAEGYWDIFIWFVVLGVATVGFVYFIQNCLDPKSNRVWLRFFCPFCCFVATHKESVERFFFFCFKPPESNKCSRPCSSSEESPEPQTRSELRRTPVGILSTEELSVYNGENGRRILISICGRIFDMTIGIRKKKITKNAGLSFANCLWSCFYEIMCCNQGHNFYGPGAAYHVFAGNDATFLLGAMNTDPQHRNKRNFGRWDPSWVSEYTQLHPDAKIPYCEEKEFSAETLEGWLRSFIVKYPVVGKLRGFMDVCEESWNRVVNANLAPGHATQSNEPLAQFEHLSSLSLKELDSRGKKQTKDKHVSIGGFVMDVGICNFIYGPVTADFPEALGHDISVAIIKDDFTAQTLDQPVALLDSNQQVHYFFFLLFF